MIGDVANHLWQSTLFAAAAALLIVPVRRSQARVRYWIWFAASLKFLVPFAVFTTLGSQVDWAPAAEQRRVAPVAAAIVQVTDPFSDNSPVTALMPSTAAPIWRIAVITVWGLGFVVMAYTRLRLWRRIQGVVRGSVPARIAGIEMPAAVRLRSAAGLFEPGIVGVFRPILLLPAGIAEYVSPRQLEAVIAHELCHAERRDNLTAAIHMVTEAVFWFHPLVWWIGGRLLEERERACDEEVLRQFVDPETYAEGILAICRHCVDARLMCVSGVGGADLKRRIESILKNRTALSLPPATRAMLVTAGFVAVAVPFALGMLDVGSLHARAASQVGIPSPLLQVPPGPPVDPDLRFEAASIRPYDDSRGLIILRTPPGRLEARGLPVRQLLRQALRIQDHQLIGVPDWANNERFVVIAKAPDGAPLNGLPTMLINLLKDRFMLAMHAEKRELPIFSLVLARRDGKLGPALNPSSEECQAKMDAAALTPGRDGPALPGTPDGPPLFDPDKPPCGSRRTGPGIVGGGGLPLAQLALTLTQFAGRPVHDETGLAGIYDFTLRFTSNSGVSATPFGPSSGELPAADLDLPNLFTAVEEQLGLKLESRRGLVNVVVVDSIKRPTLD